MEQTDFQSEKESGYFHLPKLNSLRRHMCLMWISVYPSVSRKGDDGTVWKNGKVCTKVWPGGGVCMCVGECILFIYGKRLALGLVI